MPDPDFDITSLSEEQQLALQQFTSVTDSELNAAIPLLQKCQWNAQIAITRFFDGDADTVDPAAEAARAPPPPPLQPGRRSETLIDSLSPRSHSSRRQHDQRPDTVPRIVPTPDSQLSRPLPFPISLLLLPFNLTYTLLQRLLGTITYLCPFLPRLLSRFRPSPPPRRRHLNPRDTTARFIRDFETEYNLSPHSNTLPFAESGYAQAFDQAKRDLRFLLVVLLSPEHDDTAQFVRDTLLAPEIVAFLNDSAKHELVLWAGSAQAETFDASDLRMLMERDKKRKERRDTERHEKLDRKLRNRSGRNRGDSDKKRQEDEAKQRVEEERRREEEARRHADEERARAIVMPPIDIHPALRDEHASPEAEVVGLGIDPNQAAGPVESARSRGHAPLTTAELGEENTGTYLQYDKQDEAPTDPFADPLPSPVPELERIPSAQDSFAPLGKPIEYPVLHVAKEVRMLQSPTPPLSPVRAERVPSSLSRVATPDFPDPPSLPSERRISEPRDRRAGAWASFFRRGGTNLRRPGDEASSAASDTSFSNVSRESMRHQPIPAHLLDASALPSQRRKSSGAPARTQSKFREDLPEMPTSPSESRLPYPDVTQGAALAAATRRQNRSSKPVDIPESRAETPDPATINRTDTPVSPSVHGNRLMSTSLASMDSEGSWLASSGKRQSSQSALSRSMGSLSKRKPEFSASYEELGGDKDAEYFQRTAPSSAGQHPGTSALAEADPDEESTHMGAGAAEPSTPADALTVLGSARRQPTLVHRDPRLKSREALLTEYPATGAETGDSPTSKYEFDLGETPPESLVRSARSVDYGRAHARQVSAGSARLLDIPASKRQSVGAATPSPAGSVPPVSRTSQL
ncbi:hypothetical protein LTR82_008621 [Friedmanniomyces endolithicus]|uniref:UBX domain-containing protein n=1 Tax=Friedmanniomyces endolithicus TaxID=329885 RepID=A0AAN6J8N2_9PEZI|nr:hypothetical protein LTR82_008621 [Friedmanniomyces endolithicus]